MTKNCSKFDHCLYVQSYILQYDFFFLFIPAFGLMLKDIYYARYYASIIGSNLTSCILLLPHPVKKVFDRKLVQRNSAAMKRGCLPTMNFLSISHHHTHTLTLYIQRIQKLGKERRYTPPITRAKPCLSLMVNDKEKNIYQNVLIHE